MSQPSDVNANSYPHRATGAHRVTGAEGGRGWWGNRCPRGFDTLQYFETILPLVESLRCSQQDEVYFMGGGAGGGL